VPLDCPVHQRSNGYSAQRSTAKAADSINSEEQCVQRQSAEVRGAPNIEQCMSGVALDCPLQEDKASNGQLLQNPTGGVTGLVHRTGSGGAPDCPVRPSTAACPNGYVVVEGYKYPQPPPLQASKHSELCIQYKSNRLHSKTQSKRSIHSKSPNQL
jgi:hypothetical protein